VDALRDSERGTVMEVEVFEGGEYRVVVGGGALAAETSRHGEVLARTCFVFCFCVGIKMMHSD